MEYVNAHVKGIARNDTIRCFFETCYNTQEKTESSLITTGSVLTCRSVGVKNKFHDVE